MAQPAAQANHMNFVVDRVALVIDHEKEDGVATDIDAGSGHYQSSEGDQLGFV